MKEEIPERTERQAAEAAAVDLANSLASSPEDARNAMQNSQSIAAEEASAAPARNPQWTRTDVNFLLDAALLLTFLALLFVTVVVRFLFPPAVNAAGWTLWGWSLDRWIDFQFGVLALFTLGILLHLMLHWSWVCGVVTRRFLSRAGRFKPMNQGSQTIFGVGLMIVLLNIIGLLIALAALSIENPL